MCVLPKRLRAGSAAIPARAPGDASRAPTAAFIRARPPERFLASPGHEPEGVGIRIHPWVWQMLGEYTSYLNETTQEASTLDGVAEGILERALQADGQFQQWFTAKITEDIEAWEKECVQEG